MARTFPCWCCRGQGFFHEEILEYGQGPDYDCNYCDGKCLIEIGGDIHRRIAAEAIAMKILAFKKPAKDEWTFEELRALGNKALDLV